MKSSDYWKKRFEELEKATNAYGVLTYKKIEPVFERAQRDIQKEIEAWYGRFAKNNSVSMQDARKLLNANELKEFQWDVRQYIKYGRENAINRQWLKELENASAKFHISRLEALKIAVQQAAEKAFGNELDYIDAMARKVYADAYYHSVYEMQKGLNIGFEIGKINERKLNKIIVKPWAADGRNFSDRIWQQKTQLVDEMHTQLTRNCLLGKAPDDAIKTISEKFNTAKSQAGRLVMTEEAYFRAEAQKDAFLELEVEEFEISATLDSKTSSICREMDKKHFPMREYQPGKTAPPFHCWCRSAAVPYSADDFGKVGERAARAADGKTYYVPADMSYKEWEKKYVSGKNLNAAKENVKILNKGFNRKNSNIGVFSKLEIPMQKKSVIRICKKYHIELKGINLKIQRSQELMGTCFYGSADYDNIGRIDLMPNSFINEEQLVKTIIHEKCHVEQLKTYGKKYCQEHLIEMEKEAYRIQEKEYKQLKKGMK